jgi:hypothetical protein
MNLILTAEFLPRDGIRSLYGKLSFIRLILSMRHHAQIHTWSTDGKCSIKQADQKHQAITRVSRVVDPVSPHEVTASVALAGCAVHDCTYHNSNEDTTDDEP